MQQPQPANKARKNEKPDRNRVLQCLNYKSGFRDSERNESAAYSKQICAKKVLLSKIKKQTKHIFNYLLCHNSVAKGWLYMVSFWSLLSEITHEHLA